MVEMRGNSCLGCTGLGMPPLQDWALAGLPSLHHARGLQPGAASVYCILECQLPSWHVQAALPRDGLWGQVAPGDV